MNEKECKYEDCIDVSVNGRDGLLVVDMSSRDEPFCSINYFPLCNIEIFRIYSELG